MILNCMPRSILSKEEADALRASTGAKILDVENFKEGVENPLDVVAMIPPFKYREEDLLPYENLQWIQSFSAGVNTHPLKALQERGITLTNTRGVHGPQMTDHIMGMMLAFARDFKKAVKNQEKGLWTMDYTLSELTDKELLIVGAGSIGQLLAKKAKAFDMRVVGLKRTPEPLTHFDAVLPMETLKEAVKSADYVVMLAPLTKDTRGMIGEEILYRMKKEAVLINLGRGPLVVEEDLIKALKEKVIKGAGLDVFAKEPLPEDSPLWSMEQVLLTPHLGGFSDLTNDRAIALMGENIRRFMAKEPLKNVVDLSLGY